MSLLYLVMDLVHTILLFSLFFDEGKRLWKLYIKTSNNGYLNK